MVGELNKACCHVHAVGLAAVVVNGPEEKCCNVEGVCLSLMAVERMIMSSAVSLTYWLNKVSLCHGAF